MVLLLQVRLSITHRALLPPPTGPGGLAPITGVLSGGVMMGGTAVAQSDEPR